MPSKATRSTRSAEAAAALLRRGNPWLARTVVHRYRRAALALACGHDLFSSAGVDVGTARLLRLLARPSSPFVADPRPRRVLDLGCGVGTIGLSLLAGFGESGVTATLTDRDALAIALSRANARANRLEPRILPAGFGYGPCRAAGEPAFDVIASNVPAKAGRQGIAEILFGAGSLLGKGGLLAFVHVDPLRDGIDELRAEFTERRGTVEVVAEDRGREHTAWLWRFPEGLPKERVAFPLAPWTRQDVPSALKLKGLPPYSHVGVHDVEEFDTPHFRTPLLLALIEQSCPALDGERILILNPCHGFLPVLLAKHRLPATLALLSRDTLEQAVAYRNTGAALHDWRLEARVRLEQAPALAEWPWLPSPAEADDSGYDVIAGHLRWKEGAEAHAATLAAAAAALRGPESNVVLAVGTGQIGQLRRLAHGAGLHVGREVSRHGIVAVVLRRR